MIVSISDKTITIDDKYYEMTTNGLKRAKENIIEILNQNLEPYIPKDVKYNISSLEEGIKGVTNILHNLLYIIDNIKLENNTMTLSKSMLTGGAKSYFTDVLWIQINRYEL